MSLLRAAPATRLVLNSSRIQSRPVLARFASDHAVGHKVLPFDYSNKKTFKYKYLAFMLTGFSIPFIAVSYQLSKSSGSTA